MPKVSYHKTVYFLRYTQPKSMTYLLTDIQRQKNMLKRRLLFKKNINFMG